jgi:hypothetical protein
MGISPGQNTHRYGTNATYIYEYSRGLAGVDVLQDILFSRIIYSSIIIVALVVFCGRVAQITHSHLRRITSLGATRKQQTFWSVESSPLWANIKKHVLYAPLGRKRHNREIQLSSAVNMGTVPSRFQATLVVLYVASQIAYCSYLDYAINEKAALFAELRGRSGVLAVLNMVPLFVLAGRNNPLIPLLHISFDTYNLLHRWLGRIVVLESVVHTVAWAVNACDEQDFAHMLERIRTTPFFIWGLLGTAAMVLLSLHSPSPVRHAFYETFLHVHQLAAFAAFLGVYMHLRMDQLPQISWVTAIAVIWALERTARFARLLYLNVSLRNGATRAVVEALPGEACRVTFHLPKRVPVDPGSHVYVYLPSISLWMSHPFSVAWAEPSGITAPTDHPRSPSTLEKQPVLDLDPYLAPSPRSQITLLITARQGMTRTLYNRALHSAGGTLHTPAYLEGPYPSSMPTNHASYGTAILFSAGAGITHHMLTVRHLLHLTATQRSSTRQIVLVWSVRSSDHLCWVQGFMDHILRLPSRRDVLVIKLFISKPRSSRDIVSPSSTVQMFPGRCRPGVVLDEVLPSRVGASLVSVCGPGAFADEVRGAARGWIGRGAVVDFVEEAFTW